MAFSAAGINLEWQGEGVDEIGIDSDSGKTVVRIDDQYYRPAEVGLLIGDPSKAKEELGWSATTSLDELCKMMVLV